MHRMDLKIITWHNVLFKLQSVCRSDFIAFDAGLCALRRKTHGKIWKSFENICVTVGNRRWLTSTHSKSFSREQQTLSACVATRRTVGSNGRQPAKPQTHIKRYRKADDYHHLSSKKMVNSTAFLASPAPHDRKYVEINASESKATDWSVEWSSTLDEIQPKGNLAELNFVRLRTINDNNI